MTGERIAVTGGTGKAGRATLELLRADGFEAVDVDVVASRDPDAPTTVADLTDYGQCIDALAGFDAVVHLAAIPAPNVLTGTETFRINTMSTYNVFRAASTLGLQRVVWASSETLIGIPLQDLPPRYAPIDEAHPRLPQSSYALSKLVGEDMAAEFARWTGTPHVALRISNIMTPADYRDRFPTFWDDPRTRAWNLWGYVDDRDVAQAVRCGLVADVEGADSFLVAAGDTCMKTTSAELMAECYPDVPLSRPVEGYETLLSVEKARAVLGYEPKRSWRDHVG